MLDEPTDLAGSRTANYPEFPDSCLWVQRTILGIVLQTLADCSASFPGTALQSELAGACESHFESYSLSRPETSGIYYLSTENFEKGLEKPR
jgi:hypothetical protein